MSKITKINDLSNSSLRKKFLEEKFIPETDLAVAMGRVSIKKNKEKGHSDEAQLERIEEYLLKSKLVLACNPWDVPETGFKHEKRKKFIEMLNLVKASQNSPKPIKHIVFSHQSRSNRNRESAREIESLIRGHDVSLHCIRDNLVLTRLSPLEDWMKWDIFNALNEKQSADHTKNVMDGMIKRLEMGLSCSKAPYGYRNFRPSEKELSVFVFNGKTADFMRIAFELVATSLYSLEDVATELHYHKDFLDLKRKPSAKRLSDLLRNPFYYGNFVWGDGELRKGNPEGHPPLVSYELWNKVQAVLGENPSKAHHGEHHYLEMIRCGGHILNENGVETDEPCGCAVTAEKVPKKLADGTVKKYPYYRCSNSTRPCSQRDKGFMRIASNHTISYPESEIEHLFQAVFKPMAFDDADRKWMQEFLQQEHRRKSGDHKQHHAALQRRLSMLESYIDKAYEDKLKGDIEEDVWRNQHEKWTAEKNKIKHELDAIETAKDDYIQKGVLLIELAQRSEFIYKNGSPAIKRKLVEIVSSNRVLKDGKLRFDYKRPFDLLAKGSPKEVWWSRSESNRRHPACKAGALPIELRPLMTSNIYVRLLLIISLED